MHNNHLFLSLDDDVDDDGCAHQRGHGSKGYDAVLAWQEADEVADEGNGGSAENGGRQQETVVVGAQQQSCDVRHGQRNE